METLKETRMKRGIKSCAVADAIGVSRITYYKYEKDPSLMRIKDAKKACEFIGCDPLEVSFFA